MVKSKAVVTGGSGFIGSHVVDKLMNDGWEEVVVYDDLRTGQEFYLDQWKDDPRLKKVVADVLDTEMLNEAMQGVELVVHFQANADVRGGLENRRIDLEQNTIATWNVCEAASLGGAKMLAFASSATVYGEPGVFPTPESVATVQTSLYGASKLCGEAMLQAYSEYFNIPVRIFRFVSWTGPRYSHGVIFDFFKKLRANPKQLEILGDGKQRKSYLDVRDGIAGIFRSFEYGKDRVGIYNLGHDDWMQVTELAAIICDEMGLKNVEYVFTGGERGWVGDSPVVHLDTTRLKDLGWVPTVSIEKSIRDTVKYIIKNENQILR
jgi:UDP-glucose 4-epimerase